MSSDLSRKENQIKMTNMVLEIEPIYKDEKGSFVVLEHFVCQAFMEILFKLAMRMKKRPNFRIKAIEQLTMDVFEKALKEYHKVMKEKEEHGKEI